MRAQTIHALISALAQDERNLNGTQFLAPLTGEGRARLRVRGLVYELDVINPRPGWWVCQAVSVKHAETMREADPWQRGEYLALWPVLRLVLVEPLQHTDWLALPYNPSDAAQRFNLGGPLVVRLVEGGQPFDRVIGRVEGTIVWYDEPDRRGDVQIAEQLRHALAERQEEIAIPNLGHGERAAYALLASRWEDQRSEMRLRDALEVAGARLIGYEAIEDGLRVIWERDGQRGITIVDPHLGVASAGICLSGQDARFDLTSIVGVVSDAPDYARWNGE